MRNSEIIRKTAETDISLFLELDGKGRSEIDSGCPFLDHMLTLFSSHGKFDLTLKCCGDVETDYHHSVEDISICLGKAFKEALGSKKGICRYGSMILPMDEALIVTAIDFSGRSFLGFDAAIPSQKVGTFDTELVQEFWQGFCRSAECTLHIKELDGLNSHHIIEAIFKSAARSIRQAVSIDPLAQDEIPSTKGVL